MDEISLCSQGTLILLVTLLFFHLEQHASTTSPERKVASNILSTDSTFNEKRQSQHHSLALCTHFDCANYLIFSVLEGMSCLSPSVASHLGLTSE